MKRAKKQFMLSGAGVRILGEKLKAFLNFEKVKDNLKTDKDFIIEKEITFSYFRYSSFPQDNVSDNISKWPCPSKSGYGRS